MTFDAEVKRLVLGGQRNDATPSRIGCGWPKFRISTRNGLIFRLCAAASAPLRQPAGIRIAVTNDRLTRQRQNECKITKRVLHTKIIDVIVFAMIAPDKKRGEVDHLNATEQS